LPALRAAGPAAEAPIAPGNGEQRVFLLRVKQTVVTVVAGRYNNVSTDRPAVARPNVSFSVSSFPRSQSRHSLSVLVISTKNVVTRRSRANSSGMSGAASSQDLKVGMPTSSIVVSPGCSGSEGSAR